MSQEKLGKILEAGDTKKCVKFFKGMPEKERRSLAPFCLDWFNKQRKNEFIQTSATSWEANQLMPAAEVAVFATASGSEITKLARHARPADEYLFELLTDRQPSWVSSWASQMTEAPNNWSTWSLVRRLIRAGLTQKPDSPNYYTGMISGLGGPGSAYNDKISLQDCLLEDPELLEDEVWRLFEFDGDGENSLANWDRFSRGGKWSDALLHLAKKGHLPRERLLSCSLDALDRDFNHYRAKWFSSLYDDLKPTANEQAAHAERFLHLLGVTAPNVVSWAYAKVEKLAKAKAYEPPTLLAGLEPVLLARQKGMVKKALKLAATVVKSSPETAPRAALVVTGALGHEAAEIQEAALDFIEQHGQADNEQLKDRVLAHAEVIAPSLRSRLDRWSDGEQSLQPAEQPAPALDAGELKKALAEIDPQFRSLYCLDELQQNLAQERLAIPTVKFDGTEIPRLDPQRRLEPIADLEEVLDVAARVIEDPAIIDEAERAIDGLSRLCGDLPEDFERRIGPVLKRATDRLKKQNAAPFVGMQTSDDLCGLIYAFGTQQVIRTKPDGERIAFDIEGDVWGWWDKNLAKPIGILSRRSLAVAERLAERKPAPLLSMPTHAGGWIDPALLVERANDWKGDSPHVTDVCLALLRMAPDGRAAALKQLKRKSSDAEWKQAIRYALGGKTTSVGESAPLWVAAARARAPFADDELVTKGFPKLGPDAGQAAQYSFRIAPSRSSHKLIVECQPALPQKIDPDCVTVTFHQKLGPGYHLDWELGQLAGRTVGSVRWTCSIWPIARESLFAAAAEIFAANLDWWEARWQNKALLEPLLDSGTPLRSMGLLLLTLALAAKEPGESGLAVDIAIAAIEDGRLSAENLGPLLRELLASGLIKPGRWQNTLAVVGGASPVHALVVQQSLVQALQGDPKKMPRDYGKLLETLKEISIGIGHAITDQGCRDFLQKIKGSGKVAKTASALLKLEQADSASSGQQAMQQAIEFRLNAARRRQEWQG